MIRDLIFCLQEATVYLIFKKSWLPKDPAECFVNPPCGCANPGKSLKCEDCPHLEACLSNIKLQKPRLSNSKFVLETWDRPKATPSTFGKIRLRKLGGTQTDTANFRQNSKLPNIPVDVGVQVGKDSNAHVSKS
ncbi:hypothetical protein Cylst_1173 [Cylindrospermum stagnale PCC 7417]|uniref:Uncharacterized protein n=1 Tax=Cylindrospermum stagnale PCC 7417 TaxID=56107 RepID=K9WSW6_9NOST|nr:hypothetical protein Cylst_1173 [Cylindrospermum stagnale PCC 7417]